MGSPCMLPSFAHAPFAQLADHFFPVPFGLECDVGNRTSTWACMLAEMPVPVGHVSPWPEDHVFASTPNKDYRMADMSQFLYDVQQSALNDPAVSCRKFGPALYPSALELAGAMKAPQVPTHLIYSDGMDTIAQLKYNSDCLTGKREVSM